MAGVRSSSEPSDPLTVDPLTIDQAAQVLNRINNRVTYRDEYVDRDGCYITGTCVFERVHILPHSVRGSHLFIKWLMYTGILPMIQDDSHDIGLESIDVQKHYLEKYSHTNVNRFSVQLSSSAKKYPGRVMLCPSLRCMRRLCYLFEREFAEMEAIPDFDFNDFNSMELLRRWSDPDLFVTFDAGDGRGPQPESWQFSHQISEESSLNLFEYDILFYTTTKGVLEVHYQEMPDDITFKFDHCALHSMIRPPPLPQGDSQDDVIQSKVSQESSQTNSASFERPAYPISYNPPLAPLLLTTNPFFALGACWLGWKALQDNLCGREKMDEEHFRIRSNMTRYLLSLAESPQPSHFRYLDRPTELGFALPSPPSQECWASRWTGYSSDICSLHIIGTGETPVDGMIDTEEKDERNDGCTFDDGLIKDFPKADQRILVPFIKEIEEMDVLEMVAKARELATELSILSWESHTQIAELMSSHHNALSLLLVNMDQQPVEFKKLQIKIREQQCKYNYLIDELKWVRKNCDIDFDLDTLDMEFWSEEKMNQLRKEHLAAEQLKRKSSASTSASN